MICQQCFIEFTPIKSGYWRKRKFCSPKCSQLSQVGKKVNYTQEWRDKISKAGKGKKFTEEHKRKIGLAHKGITKHPELSKYNKEHSGKNSNNWQGGISSLNARFRMTKEFQDWRFAVFKRDNFTCQDCGKKGKKLNADHIKPFCIFPELRLDINNGQTLCEIPCHKNKTIRDWELIKKIRVKFRV